MSASRPVLKLLAFITWLTGGVVLFFKGYALFAGAVDLRPGADLNPLPFVIAVPVGALKIRYIFLPACRKNLARIDSLADPEVWQFFRPGFFLFLITMISLGALMSRFAEGNYGAMLTVSSVDLALSVALMGSLGGFRKEPGVMSQESEGKDVSA